MMKSFFSLLVILYAVSSLAIGQNIEIDSKLFFEGRKVGSPRILTVIGKKAKVIMNDQKNNQEYSLEVLPKRAGGKIKLHYSLVVREKKAETFTRGEINLKENKNASISLDKGKIKIQLKVKKTL